MRSQEAVLRQVLQDFESLALLLERAIDALGADDPWGANGETLEQARDLARTGAALTSRGLQSG